MGSERDDDILSQVYKIKSADEAKEVYARWAKTYDHDVEANGYATPGRLAAALREHMEPGPILDYGCGTGISGVALAEAGFATIDGTDISPEMLAAASDRGVYRKTWISEPGALGVEPGDYDAIAAVGVISTGAAPASTMDLLLEKLEPGGILAFSLNDHALNDPSFNERIDANTAKGRAAIIFREHGIHMPGVDLGSDVVLLRRT